MCALVCVDWSKMVAASILPLGLSGKYNLRLRCFSPGSYAACKFISLIIRVRCGPPPGLMTIFPGPASTLDGQNITNAPTPYPLSHSHTRTHTPTLTWKNCVSSTQKNGGVFVLLDNIMGWCIIRLQCHFEKPWIQIMWRKWGRMRRDRKGETWRIDGAFSNPVWLLSFISGRVVSPWHTHI